jgi:Peptidase propeptide and YPEB domain
MRSALVVGTIFALWLGVGVTAFASEENRATVGAPREQWRPLSEIIEQFTTMGYQVQGIEGDDNLYEVEAIDPNGLWIKADVHPVSGEILREQSDDD